MANLDQPFIPYGTAHCLVFVLTIGVPLILSWYARQHPSARRYLAWGLAALLLGTDLALLFSGTSRGGNDWRGLLPMHLCDWVLFLAVAALLWRGQFLYELTYFLGLAGTLQGLITPDLAYGFPHFYFFTFFLIHGGIIAAILFLSFGLRLRPYPKSILRVFLFLQFYVLCAWLTNWVLDTNFGYLRAKPTHASLMDWLGPWPWYLLVLEILAPLFLLVYYLPWWLWDQYQKKADRGA